MFYDITKSKIASQRLFNFPHVPQILRIPALNIDP